MIESVMTTSATTPRESTRDDDPRLIARCLDGDETAWVDLVGRYDRLVFAVGRRAGLSQEDAEDVFQVVFTTLYRRLDGLRDQERLAAWLITTTRREAIRVRRHARPHDELADELPATDAPTEQVVERELMSQTVREAMAALDDRCASLLRALFLDTEQAYAAIAARFGIAVGSIGPTRARCLAKLKTLLDDRGFLPADVS